MFECSYTGFSRTISKTSCSIVTGWPLPTYSRLRSSPVTPNFESLHWDHTYKEQLDGVLNDVFNLHKHSNVSVCVCITPMCLCDAVLVCVCECVHVSVCASASVCVCVSVMCVCVTLLTTSFLTAPLRKRRRFASCDCCQRGALDHGIPRAESGRRSESSMCAPRELC